LGIFDLVAQAGFPNMNSIPESDRLPKLRQLFETLYDGTNPLRIALDRLQTLDTFRIIEGNGCAPSSGTGPHVEGTRRGGLA
jgi:hypothetical protein